MKMKMMLLNKLKRFAAILLYVFSLLIPLAGLVYAKDYTNLVEALSKGNAEEKEKIKQELFNGLRQIYEYTGYNNNIIDSDGYREGYSKLDGNILFDSIIGSKEEDCVVTISPYAFGNTLVFILKKEKNRYDLISHFKVGIFNSISTTNLIDKNTSELVIDSEGHGTGWKFVEREIYKWDGKVMHQIWNGVVKDIYSGGSKHKKNNYGIQADIQYIDLDNDGIKEIIRKGDSKRLLYNKETKGYDEVKNTFYREYKWDSKNFKYQLKVSQGNDK